MREQAKAAAEADRADTVRALGVRDETIDALGKRMGATVSWRS